MFVRRRVAAPHRPALHTHPQMNPRTADLQTILTTLRRRLHLMNLVQMSTPHRHTFLASKFYSFRCVIPSKGAKPFTPLQPLDMAKTPRSESALLLQPSKLVILSRTRNPALAFAVALAFASALLVVIPKGSAVAFVFCRLPVLLPPPKESSFRPKLLTASS